MSNKLETSKIAPSKINLSAIAMHKIKVYVEHGVVFLEGEHYKPINNQEAYELICPKEKRSSFKQYLSHVQLQLQLANNE